MQLKELITFLQEKIPLNYAEDFDNVGLLTGSTTMKIKGVLVTLDTLKDTVDEAITKGCNVIISFHPIIFKGIKSLTGKSYVERTIIKAIKNDIAIYAIHTALDNQISGVSGKMAEVLGLKNINVLIPKRETIKKLTLFVPVDAIEEVQKSLFDAGAGTIGNYSECSFYTQGIGTYLPNELANPTIGKTGVLQKEPEMALTVYFESHKTSAILRAMYAVHPYEEVAYELATLDNINQNIGMGVVGEFKDTMTEEDFLALIKKTYNTTNIRHSAKLDKPIKKVALLGGSGSFALKNALDTGADAFISADFKYHDFFGAEDQLLIVDIGHYESEQFTKNLLTELIQKKFTNFATVLSETQSNPIYNYH